MSEAIKVVVRVRPMNSKQSALNCKSIVSVYQEERQLTLAHPSQPDNIKNFAFDHVFGTNSQQQVVYSRTAYDLVQNVLLGYNGTIFAYGQTGCGKTHSMIGKVDVPQLQGIIPRSFGHLLKSIEEEKEKEFLLRCSFIQIYNEQVRDLLSNDVKMKLDIKQSPQKGVFIKDLSMNSAKNYDDLMGYMAIGNKNRSVGQTAMNKDSSRSHLLFMLFLESAVITDSQDKKYVASKLNLVDLAGSQRLSKTGAEGDRLKEAQKINLSLSALGNVISALVDGKSHHIPYRDSKLTRLLQDSLGGNTKTVMIANCSPADYNFDQTLSTLRYASRAKFIKNKPIINEDPKDALLKEYAEQLKKLKEMIYKQSNGGSPSIETPLKRNDSKISLLIKNKEEQLRQQKQEKNELMKKINELQKMHLVGSQVKMEKKVRQSVIRVSLLHRKESLVETQEQILASSMVKSTQQKLDQQQKIIQTKTNLNDISSVHKEYKGFIQKLHKEIRRLEFDLKDINHEHFADKQIILDDLRAVTKQNKLLAAISNIIVSPEQLSQIKQNAYYSEQKEDYKIPSFAFKNKEICLPKLPQGIQDPDVYKPMEYKSNNLKQKQKIVNNSCVVEKKKSSQDSSIRGILNEARIVNNSALKEEKKNHFMRKVILQPIKKNI